MSVILIARITIMVVAMSLCFAAGAHSVHDAPLAWVCAMAAVLLFMTFGATFIPARDD